MRLLFYTAETLCPNVSFIAIRLDHVGRNLMPLLHVAKAARVGHLRKGGRIQRSNISGETPARSSENVTLVGSSHRA